MPTGSALWSRYLGNLLGVREELVLEQPWRALQLVYELIQVPQRHGASVEYCISI
jgi:hypothetical protein